MIPADEFIGHMNNCLRLIEETAVGEAVKQKGKLTAAAGKNILLGLMTLNF